MNLLKRLRAPHNDAGAGSPEPPVPAVEVRHSVETTTAPASPSTRLREQADRRVNDAVREGLDQLANGWRTREVLAVLKDAATIVADLREQAIEAEGREIAESLERANAWYRDNPRVEATA